MNTGLTEFTATNGIRVRWLDKVFSPGFKFSGKPKRGKADEGWVQLLDEKYLDALREFILNESVTSISDWERRRVIEDILSYRLLPDSVSEYLRGYLDAMEEA